MGRAIDFFEKSNLAALGIKQIIYLSVQKTPRDGQDLFKVPDDMEEPTLTILVAGKEQFPHPEGLDSQRYALVLTFSFDGEEIDLYNLIRQRVRIEERVKV